MAGVIYYIRSAATGRTYVGSTTRGIKQRWSEHLHYLFKGRCMNGAPVSDSIYAAHAAARGRKVPDSERKRRSESAKRAIARECRESQA